MTLLRQFRSALPALSRPALASRAVEFAIVAVLAGALAATRWDEMGSLPTGLDAGNWLAFGRGMFGNGKSTAGAYPPLVPLLANLCRASGETFDGLRALSVASLLLPALAMYGVARPFTGPWFAVASAAVVAFGRPFGEAAAFGGYPQNLAACFGLTASAAACAFLVGGQRRWLVTATGALLLTALTHHLYFVFSLVWLTAAGGLWLLTVRGSIVRAVRTRLAFAVPAAAGTAAFLPTWILIERANYSPPFNAAETSRWEAWKYAAGGDAWLWAGLGAIGVAGLVMARSDSQVKPLWLVGAGALATGLGGFAVTGEGRLLALAFFGIAAGVALAGDTVARRLAATHLAGIPAAMVLGLVFVVPAAESQAREDFAYYRTLEPGMIGSARWLDANARGERAVVGASGRGWPIGWWFEGLTGDVEIIVGSDLRWVAFEDERKHAQLARQFFSFGRSESEIRELGQREDVRYLVFSAADWSGWQDWGARAHFVYTSDTYRILDLRALGDVP